MKRKRLLLILTILMMTTFKGLSKEHLSQTHHRNDSIAPIAPKGYVLLSYTGARNALKAKAEADAYKRIVEIKDSIIYFNNQNVEILRAYNKQQSETIQIYESVL